MRQAYEASRQGHLPVVLLLSGESGIGKTALVGAFVSQLEQAWVLVGRCYEREFVPYKAFDAAIDGLCRYLTQLSDSELADVLPGQFRGAVSAVSSVGPRPRAEHTTDGGQRGRP